MIIMHYSKESAFKNKNKGESVALFAPKITPPKEKTDLMMFDENVLELAVLNVRKVLKKV